LRNKIQAIINRTKSLWIRCSYQSCDANDWSQFYMRFENRFRGSAELISRRLTDRYKTRLAATFEKFPKNELKHFVDLGCGRGEMLELAKSVGFATHGCDSLASASSASQDLGHDVLQIDILSYLKQLDNNSQHAISCLHVIEHVPAEYFWKVMKECQRVMAPGGLLIVETPNLQTLYVAARQFYLDPTHHQPIHPEYMKFLAEDVGFKQVELMEFDEVQSPDRAALAKVGAAASKPEYTKLERWLYGPMDVACLGMK